MSTLEFNHLLISNRPIMRGFAINFTRNVEDAEDLIQDTFLKALKYKDRFEDGTNFKGWLYTIMRNIFLNNCKKQQLGRNIFGPSADSVPYELGSQAENNIYRLINEQDIRVAVGALREELRRPFQMAYEGYQYDEIAQEMGIPTGTIKSRIFNARKKLMEDLKDFN
jgi:RNA polymerase sigma factor (sigma-70 family)